MKFFNKSKQEDANAQETFDAMRFAAIYEMLQAGFDAGIANIVAFTLMPLETEPSRALEDLIRSRAAIVALEIGSIRRTKIINLESKKQIVACCYSAVCDYINHAKSTNEESYPGMRDWLDIKKGIDLTGEL